MTATAAAELVLTWLQRSVLAVGIAALLGCAAMVAVGRRHRSGLVQDGLVSAAWVLGGLTLAAIAATVVGVLAG